MVDEETGKPIDKFRVVTGIVFNGNDRVSWERPNSETRSRNGKIDYTESWARPAFAMRIEADGYLPEERKGFTLEDREVNFDIKLKKAEDIKLTVKKPDGSPAAGVKGYLVLAGENLNINDGTDANNWACPEATSDNQGKLEFPPQLGEFILVVTGKDGYAQVEQSALAESNSVDLQAWGRIEGTVTLDDKPAADVTVGGAAGSINMRPNGPQIYHNLSTKTDAQGKFSFAHVPPGSVSVYRSEQVPMGNRMFRVNQSMQQVVNVNAGETATVSLGKAPDATEGK